MLDLKTLNAAKLINATCNVLRKENKLPNMLDNLSLQHTNKNLWVMITKQYLKIDNLPEYLHCMAVKR